MSRRLPKYVYLERTRHGAKVFYFRKGKGPRLRLPPYGQPGFEAAYLQALESSVQARPNRKTAGTLEWLIAQYRETAAYAGLSPATRRQRDNIFKGIIEKSGDVPFRLVTRRKVTQGRDARKDTPAQARNFLDAMRGLFRWAAEAEHVSEDPTAGVKNPIRPDGAGFEQWTGADVAAYERKWPEGSKERVWLHVLLYTGLRRGDAVQLGKQHVRDGIATFKTEKTGTEVTIPIPDELARTLEAGPTGDLAFIVGENGRPLTKETFGNFFRHACNEAGVNKSAHGLRKLAATFAAEAGATVSELEAMFGWSGGAMAAHYTRAADRKRLAATGAEKVRLAREAEQGVDKKTPHLSGKSPAPIKKAR